MPAPAPAYTEKFSVAARDYAAAGEVSAKVKSILRKIGIDPALIRRITIAAYEAEINMIIHSFGGVITLEITPDEVYISCDDTGPGIEDIELAMQEGYSTAPTSIRMMGFGAGMGLSNIKKNSDVFDITSSKEGTSLKLRFNIGVPNEP
ncbi:MAG: ATP-binding protein [Burkholderiales bacterium]